MTQSLILEIFGKFLAKFFFKMVFGLIFFGECVIIGIESVMIYYAEVEIMPNNAETIEKLAKQLEQQKFLSDLQECHTLEDFQKLVEKYKAICEKHER